MIKPLSLRTRSLYPRRFFTQMLIAGLISLFACDAHVARAQQQQQSDPIVVIQTTKGNLAIRVFLSMVPTTSRNFLDLVSRGFYNGLSFHRWENWCIQGGDPAGNGTGNFVDPQTGQVRYLRLEVNPMLRHRQPGVVAMARSNNPNSASCQFYITKAAMPQLDGQYAIFGQVVKGMDTVMRIQRGDRMITAEIIDPSTGQVMGGRTQQQGESQPSQTPSPSGGGYPGRSSTDSGF